MKTFLQLLCLMAVLLGFSLPLLAQVPQDSAKVVIETKDGNEYLGVIAGQDSAQIELRTDNIGTITIQKAEVKSIRPASIGRIVDGKYWYENPHPTRYFYGTNGYGLRKGEGYYQNVWVLLNQVSYGFTNHFSMGAGLVPTFLFGEGNALPILVNAQFSIPVKPEKMQVGIGGFYVNEIGGDESGMGLGFLYGNVTLGSRDKNISFQVGYGYNNYNYSDLPVVSVSGTVRVSRRTYLMMENYFFGVDDSIVGLFSLGGRYAARRLAIDYGLVIPADFGGSSFTAVPWLGIVSPFGRAKD
jgi:hypothetical protein